MRRAVIVLPTFNEAGNISSLIQAIFQVTNNIPNWQISVLVVDSQSTDETATLVKELMRKFRDRLYLLETKKEGLGKAYVRGFDFAINKLNPFVLFEMDADWSHNPKDIPLFLKKIEQGADFVYGSRYIKNGSIPNNWAIHRKIFSVFGNFIIRCGFMKMKITDWTNGFRAIKVWIIKDTLSYLHKFSGYVFQIALLDRVEKKGAHIAQVPCNFRDREKGFSKINFSQYIFQILSYIFFNSPFIKFAIVGLIGFVIDFGIAYILIDKTHLEKSLYGEANAISAEAAIISNFVLNNFWSFSHKKLEAKKSTYLFQFMKFNLISSGSIIIQWLSIKVLTNLLGGTYWYFYKVAIIALVIIPYSYFLYNRIIWKDKR